MATKCKIPLFLELIDLAKAFDAKIMSCLHFNLARLYCKQHLSIEVMCYINVL